MGSLIGQVFSSSEHATLKPCSEPSQCKATVMKMTKLVTKLIGFSMAVLDHWVLHDLEGGHWNTSGFFEFPTSSEKSERHSSS